MSTAPLLALGICLSLQGAPQPLVVFIPGDRFTLAWTHSIELQRWEEDYEVRPGPQPPPDARLVNGWYQYTPTETLPARLLLSRSAYVADYERCDALQGCQPLAHWLPSDGGVTELTACMRAVPAIAMSLASR